MKPVNPTMSERIVRNKMNDIDDASMKMVADRHDLRGNPRGLMLLPDTHLNADKKRGRVLALPLMLMR
jgi:hypothetical protein